MPPEKAIIMSPAIEQFELANGLKVILENMPHRNSVTVGIWIPIGSRYENKSEMGYSHFTEHLLFKGTKKRTYKDISLAIDRLGGHMNASTSKEITNYYITLSPKFIEVSLDVLSDIFFHSIIPEEEFGVEKRVILEEIKMGHDNPDDLLFDNFYQDAFGDTPLGRPIAGTLDSIGNSTRDKLKKYYHDQYGSKGSVLSIAGGLWSTQQELDILKNKIEIFFDLEDKSLPGGIPCLEELEKNQIRAKTTIHHFNKKLEQVHFAFGMPAPPETEEDTAYLKIFTHLMGGTMSSRLFRKLREENGLCYSVSTFYAKYIHEGLWGVYCGTSKETFLKAISLMMQELKKAVYDGISTKELEETKNGLAGSIELSMESPFLRANFNAQSLIYYKNTRDWQDIIRKIETTTLEDIMEKLISLWGNQGYILSSLGDIDSREIEQSIQEAHPTNLIVENEMSYTV